MTVSYPLKIVGLGRYLPDRVVSNREVEKLCGLPSGWIDESGAGVKSRRWVDGETTRYMGAQAARRAVDDAGLSWNDIDLIVNATGIAEQVLPDGACLIQRELGLGDSGIACMSVHTTCLGFLSALDVAGSFLRARRYETILIVNSEIPSAGLNFDDPGSSILFGDAATAAVVRRAGDGEASRIESVSFETYGDGSHLTEVRGGGTRRHPSDDRTRREDNLFSMDGEEVFWMSLQYFPGFMERYWPQWLAGGHDRVDWIVPHQASRAALDALSRLGVPGDKIVTTIEDYGNCVSASIPLTLHRGLEEGIERGDRLLLLGTGAGLSFGAMTLIY